MSTRSGEGSFERWTARVGDPSEKGLREVLVEVSLTVGAGASSMPASLCFEGYGAGIPLKSYLASSIALSFLCVALVGCPEGGLVPEVSDDAGLSGAAASAETADASEQDGSRDAGPQPAGEAKKGAAPSGSKAQPKRAAADAGAPEVEMTDSGAPVSSDDAGAQPPRQAGASDAGSTPASGEIETVMMYVVYSFGIGGGVYPNPRPIILFKDGSATTDINFVVRGLDVPTHKVMFPDTWTEWKTIDGKVARRNGMSWTALDFQLKYPPNASSLALDDTFTHLNGLTIGETTAFTQKSVRFFSDHRVIWGSSAGVIDPNATVASLPPDQRGTYQIDGYTIEFKWDDGKITEASFVWSEQDPGAVFIAGAGYVLLD